MGGKGKPRCEFDGYYLQVESEALHQFCHVHDGTVQNAKEDRNILTIFEVGIDLGCYIIDRSRDLFIRNECFERLVFQCHFFHVINNCKYVTNLINDYKIKKNMQLF